MKQKLFLLFFGVLLFASATTYGQLTKGSYMGGINLSSSWGSITTNPFEKSKFILGVSPDAGYFFADKMVIGVSTPIQIIRPSGLNTGVFGFSPFFRLYFGDYKYVKFFMVAKAGYNDLSKLLMGTQLPTQNGTAYFGGGASFFFSKQIAIEGLLKYEGTYSENSSPASAVGGEIGIQYYFSLGSTTKTKK